MTLSTTSMVITPKGIGKRPQKTLRTAGYELVNDEFVDNTLLSMALEEMQPLVLANDGISLRDPVPADDPTQALVTALDALTFTVATGQISVTPKVYGSLTTAIAFLEENALTSMNYPDVNGQLIRVTLTELIDGKAHGMTEAITITGAT